MRMIDADIIDGEEPLSKALNFLLGTGTSVMVTQKGKYYGLIDDRDIRQVSNASNTKAVSAAVRAPQLEEGAPLEDVMRSFMAGHFKALPVVRKGKIIGAVSRADVMNELVKGGKVPKTSVSALMASPVYTIDRNEKLGVAKNLMRKLGVHHLAVTTNKKVMGTISTFDLSMILLKPKGRERFILTSEITNADSRQVHEYMRERLITVEAGEPLETAVKKMAKHSISNMIVMEGGKAVGVLTATDVMKFVLSLVSEGPNVFISGLPEEDMFYYEDVRNTIHEAVKRFGKTFGLGDIHINIKKGKSAYNMRTRVEVEHDSLVVHSEGYDLKTVVNMNAGEIKSLLNKRKNYKRDKTKHYSTEGFYEEGAG